MSLFGKNVKKSTIKAFLIHFTTRDLNFIASFTNLKNVLVWTTGYIPTYVKYVYGCRWRGVRQLNHRTTSALDSDPERERDFRGGEMFGMVVFFYFFQAEKARLV